MNTLIQYYENTFNADLAIITAKHPGHDNTLSAHYLKPGKECVLESILEPEKFLLCLFFRVLLSQAVHHTNRPYHHDFIKLYPAPEFRGILASYYTNMPPSHLIVLSVMHSDSSDSVKIDLSEFSDYISVEMVNMLENWKNQITIKEDDSGIIDGVFSAMHGEIALSALGTLGADPDEIGTYFAHKYSISKASERLVIIRDALYRQLENI